MESSQIKIFKKLIKERTTLKIFHRNYIFPKYPKITYNYFIVQLNNHWDMSREVEEAIEKYIEDMS